MTHLTVWSILVSCSVSRWGWIWKTLENTLARIHGLMGDWSYIWHAKYYCPCVAHVGDTSICVRWNLRYLILAPANSYCAGFSDNLWISRCTQEGCALRTPLVNNVIWAESMHVRLWFSPSKSCCTNAQTCVRICGIHPPWQSQGGHETVHCFWSGIHPRPPDRRCRCIDSGFPFASGGLQVLHKAFYHTLASLRCGPDRLSARINVHTPVYQQTVWHMHIL